MEAVYDHIMADHRLRTLEITHFKRFEHLKLRLGNFHLLVGPNNSGKSTLLEACQLFDFCYRSTLVRRGEELAFSASRVNEAIPTADLRDLWHGRRSEDGEKLVPLRLAAELRSGGRYAFEMTRSLGRLDIRPDPENSPPIALDSFGIVLIPGHIDFWPREERRTPAVIREMRAQGQHAAIVRNLLLDLRGDEERWRIFRDLLDEVFPDTRLQPPEFDQQVDRYIRATYNEGGEDVEGGDNVPEDVFDLFSAGTGFHQFVQIFSAIFSEQATTILLDEPDAHLFSRLQARLYDVLRKLVAEGRQVIAATHSPELIAAAEPTQILSFANGTPRRLAVRSEVSSLARSLGALENVSLLLIDAWERVVVVEDRSDEIYLRWWLEKVLPPPRWRRLAGRLVFLHAHQRPVPAGVNVMLDTLQKAFAEERRLRVDALVVADRDYRMEEELAAEEKKLAGAAFARQQWVVWERTEIESYLIDEKPLVRTVMERLAEAGQEERPSESEIRAWVDEAMEASREVVLARLADAWGRVHRKAQPSTCLARARERLDAVWTEPSGRVAWCDVKDVVLPRLRGRLQTGFRVSLPDRAIVEAFRPEEVAPDLRRACEKIAAFVLGDSDVATG